MERNLCKMQYVVKAKTTFKIRKNNHRSSSSDANMIRAYHHFAQGNHNFTTLAKFTLIEMITNKNKSIEVMQDIRRKCEKF